MLRFICTLLFMTAHLLAEPFVFQEPPENFSPKIEVAGCFIFVGDDVLFLKQQPFDSEPNAWGVPGGKVKRGETAPQAILREVNEETGICLERDQLHYKGTVFIRYPEMDFVYTMFETCLEDYPDSIVIDPEEHVEYRWMSLEEALELHLIRGEDECIHMLYDGQLV